MAANTARNAGHPRPPGFPHVGVDPLDATQTDSPMAEDFSSPRGESPVRRRTSSTGTNSRSASFSLPNLKSGSARQVVGDDKVDGEVAEEDDDEPLDPAGEFHFTDVLTDR